MDWQLLHRREDGSFVIRRRGNPYHVTPSDPLYAAVAEAAEGKDLPPEAASIIPPPPPDVAARLQRDALLDASDRWMVPDRPISDETRAAWAAYRQALRDVSQQPGFPHAIQWPTPPA